MPRAGLGQNLLGSWSISFLEQETAPKEGQGPGGADWGWGWGYLSESRQSPHDVTSIVNSHSPSYDPDEALTENIYR